MSCADVLIDISVEQAVALSPDHIIAGADNLELLSGWHVNWSGHGD